jgi:phosphatidylethanolamine-binding protein (PEBP) family uncharacterized protein
MSAHVRSRVTGRITTVSLFFALDQTVPDSVVDHGALLSAIAGHVLARGVLTGTYER